MKYATGGLMMTICLSVALSGCGTSSTENQVTKELSAQEERLTALLDNEPDAVQEVTAESENLSVTLHHVVVEPEQILVDYTVRGLSGKTYFAYFEMEDEETDGEENCYYVFATDDGEESHIMTAKRFDTDRFCTDDIGSEQNITFRFYGADEEKEAWDGEVNAAIEVKNIFTPKEVELNREVSYDNGEKSGVYQFLTYKQHLCYDELVVGELPDLDEFIMPAIYAADGKEQACYGTNQNGEDEVLVFEPLDREQDILRLAVTQYTESGKYEKISDTLEISIK